MNRDRDMVDMERSSRSVFVGNIPYEATEEKLRDIFSEVGPVVSFRLVFDRESGKPKGYGFAEYQDIETAMSAMRNLNNRELLGRVLRVDHATSEKNRIMDDLQQLGGHFGPQKESPYGEPVPAKDAPEAISKAVASLPPEQMFELMKQMKQCIQNNPVEARNMLLQNPQLAYALLQAQVVMRIVDPEIAMKMLHRQNPVPTLVPIAEPLDRPIEGRPNGDGRGLPVIEPRRMLDEPMAIPRCREGSPVDRMNLRGPLPPMRGPPDERLPLDVPMGRGRGEPMGLGPREGPMGRGRGRPLGRRSPEPFGRGPFGRPELREPGFPDRSPVDGIPGMGRLPMDRGGPPMDRGGPPMDRGGPPMDRGGPPMDRGGPPMDRGGPPMDRGGPPMDRGGPPMDRGGPPMDRGGPPMDRGGPPMDRGGPPMDRGGLPMDRGGPPFHEGRGGPPPRLLDQERGGMGAPMRDRGPSMERPAGDPRRGPIKPANEPPTPGPAPGGDPGNPDQEKAALIMQVLQLTPEQIAMLPEEQRKSILILKEQITGGRQ